MGVDNLMKGSPRFVKVLASMLCVTVAQRLIESNISPAIPPVHPSAIALAIPLAVAKFGTVVAALIGIFFFAKNLSSPVPYCLAYIVPFLTWYSANYGNYWIMLWLVFGVIPMLELATGDDVSNPTKEEEKELNGRLIFRLITMIWVPIQILLLLWSFWAAETWNLSRGHFLLFGMSIGLNTGILGINIAHELIHKSNWFEQTLGKILLVTVWYGHFFVEHIWGHHKSVSTPFDPATARLGENFYSFWTKSVVGSFLSAWHIEISRLKKKGKSFFSLQNRMLMFMIFQLVFTMMVYFTFGKKALMLHFIQSIMAFTLLEVVNYIEHYGLERKQVKDIQGPDSFESVNVMHSWNANARITNYFLFKLQRHSDHHTYAARRYQILRSFEESPQMPTGYGGMIFLAVLPPLWFHVMDARAKDFQNRETKYRHMNPPPSTLDQ